jgi:hypothetical protein
MFGTLPKIIDSQEIKNKMKITKKHKDFFFALDTLIKNIESIDKTFFTSIYNSKQYKLDKNLMSIYYMKSLPFDSISIILKSFLMLSKNKRHNFVSSIFWKRKVFSKEASFVNVDEVEEIDLSNFKGLKFCKKNIKDLFLITLYIKNSFLILEANDYHFCKYIINNASIGLLSYFTLRSAILKGIEMNMENIFKTNNYKLINKAFLTLDISTRRKEIKKYKGKNKKISRRLRLLSKQCTTKDYKEIIIEAVHSIYKFEVLRNYTSSNYFNYIEDNIKLELIFDLRDIYIDKSNLLSDIKNRAETILITIFKTLKRDKQILCIGTLKKMGWTDTNYFKFLNVSLFNDTSIL